MPTDHRVSPSVALLPTPGHTPGHVSVHITSGGESAVITGDMVHSPVQFARPEWSSVADTDSAEAVRSRERLVAIAGGATTLVIGTHFPPPTAGTSRARRRGWTFSGDQPSAPAVRRVERGNQSASASSGSSTPAATAAAAACV